MNTKRCWKCKHFLKETWHHRLCRACRKLVRATVKVVEPELYLGKKETCYLCEYQEYLYSCKCLGERVCKECKYWCEVKLKGLPKGDATF